MFNANSKAQQEIVNSIRFYFMLSIHMAANTEYSDKICSRALDQFIQDIRESKTFSEAVIQQAIKSAYTTLPGEFLSNWSIPSGRDQLTFVERSFWKKR
jgi:hypothetical protein